MYLLYILLYKDTSNIISSADVQKSADVFRLLGEIVSDFISTPPPSATGSTPNVETLRRDAALRLAVNIARRYIEQFG